MKNIAFLMLASAGFTALGSMPAMASRFDDVRLKQYLEYEEREPCQFYREPPAGFFVKACKLMRRHASPVQEIQNVQASRQESYVSLEDALISYEVNFALDSTRIEPAAAEILNNVARDVKKYNPHEIVVAGYADKSGDEGYNLAISRRRAIAVADELNHRGIATRILDEQAFGENVPAIPTPDGVALFENRRVVVKFVT